MADFISWVLALGGAIYLIWFYKRRAKVLRELKVNYPAYTTDTNGTDTYVICPWHYTVKKKYIQLYENPSKELVPIVSNGSYVKKGDKVITIKGNLSPIGQRPKFLSFSIQTLTSGYIYFTDKKYGVSNPLFDGAVLFWIEKKARKTAEQINREKLDKWPIPIHSSENDVILSSDIFNDEEKLTIEPSYDKFSLKYDDGVQDFSYVKKGQPIGRPIKKGLLTTNYLYDIPILAHRDGYLSSSKYSTLVNQKLCTIYDSIEELVKTEYPCNIGIIERVNDFSSEKEICSSNAFPIGGILLLSLTYSESIARIRLEYATKELSISKNDKIDFLFEETTLHFAVQSNPIRHSSDSKRRICDIQINEAELSVFASDYLQKIRINAKDQDSVEIANKSYKYPLEVSKRHLKSISKAFECKIHEIGGLISTIEDTPIEETNTCYVYIMRDEANGCHKIGISNKPEYREKTLQSDKPFITLIQAKEFPSRVIARAFESALHKTYESKHIRGEWFDLSPDEVNEVIQSLK